MKYCSQASGYYLRAVVSQMALDGGRTALASELPRQNRAAIPRRGWAPDRLSCSKTWLTKRSVDILVSKGLEYGKAESGREGGKRCTHCLKKRTYNRTETVIQNPDLGVRMGGLEHERKIGWEEAHPMCKEADLPPNGNQNPDPRSGARMGSGI